MDVISVNAKLPFDESQVNWKPKTNADRIRAMSDEELAGWLDQIDGVGMFPGQTQWLDWLRQEADHE